VAACGSLCYLGLTVLPSNILLVYIFFFFRFNHDVDTDCSDFMFFFVMYFCLLLVYRMRHDSDEIPEK
jgi:amino acid permease